MNTYVCFVLLLAIGLSAQSEFQADFNKMVDTVKLKDGKTLLVSTTTHATNSFKDV